MINKASTSESKAKEYEPEFKSPRTLGIKYRPRLPPRKVQANCTHFHLFPSHLLFLMQENGKHAISEPGSPKTSRFLPKCATPKLPRPRYRNQRKSRNPDPTKFLRFVTGQFNPQATLTGGNLLQASNLRTRSTTTPGSPSPTCHTRLRTYCSPASRASSSGQREPTDARNGDGGRGGWGTGPSVSVSQSGAR